MNKTVLMGRLTADPKIRYTEDENHTCIARYTLAVDRIRKQENQPTADFINCVTFGKPAEWAEKYLHKGMKIAVCGRLQTGRYTNKDGVKVYTTDVVCEEQDFCESKKDTARDEYDDEMARAAGGSGFDPEDLDDDPFNY